MPHVTLQTACPLCQSRDLRPVRTERNQLATHRSPVVREFDGAWIQLVECRDCRFGFTKELPPPEFFAARYDIPFDAAVEAASDFKDHILEALVRKVIALGVRSGRWLDVGSFAGILLRVAQRRGFQATGVEVNPTMAAYCRDVLGLDVFTGSFFDFPCPDASIDVLSMIDVLEHLPHPARVLDRCHQLLRPGGLLVIKVPHLQPQLWKQRVANTLGVNSLGVFENFGHVNHFSPASLRRALGDRGFDVLEIAVAASEHAPETSLRNKLRNRTRDLVSGTLEALRRVAGVNLGFNLLAYARRR